MVCVGLWPLFKMDAPDWETSGKRNYHRAFNHDRGLLWRFVLVRDYANAEGVILRLVNLESMIPKLRADGGNKTCVAWKIFCTCRLCTDSSTAYGKELHPVERCLIKDVVQSFHKLHDNFLNEF